MATKTEKMDAVAAVIFGECKAGRFDGERVAMLLAEVFGLPMPTARRLAVESLAAYCGTIGRADLAAQVNARFGLA